MRDVHASLPLLALMAVACSRGEPSGSFTETRTPHEILKAGGSSLAQIPGGGTIHIKCMGAGSPTVILTAGAGGSSWRKVQPRIARLTRVCAWDRLGEGYSSEINQLRTAAETSADLKAALKATRTQGPFIAVGHSLGSYESLLFKDEAPQSVVGMVLVDPSIPDQFDRLAKVAPESRKLEPPIKDKPMIDLLATSSRLVVNPKRNYGDMPLIVLTSTKEPEPPPGTPEVVIAEFSAGVAEMHRGHAELAALSSRGVRRKVPNSRHNIQDDQPEAVIGAINEVISATREKAVK